MSLDLESLREWIGRTETVEDLIAPAPAALLTATLDRDDPPSKPGDPLPPPWHWLYFLPRVKQSEIGPDGHPKRGGFLPPIPLPRRMFAGARMAFTEPLRIGEPVRRESTIADVTLKSGKSGRLVFLLLRHRIFGPRGLALEEEQDIVYRDPPDPAATPPAPPAAPQDGEWSREIRPDPVLLFRFSALTFNSHRIHYDLPYATGEEGYPGLVVQGPLLATLLLDLARRWRPGAPVGRFEFRAVSPLFATGSFSVNGAPAEGGRACRLWAAAGGALAMSATVNWA